MHLALYLSESGVHAGGWRHPRSGMDTGANVELFRRLARTAEEACFDLAFLADKLAVDDVYGGTPDEVLRTRVNVHRDPVVLLTALAGATSRIGLAATASTTYSEPFHVARMFSTIDHVSGGRAAWNAVTSVSDGEARNFSRDAHLDHSTRYDRAAEFLDAVLALWDTWDDDAVVLDRAGATYVDPTRVRRADHSGDWFRVAGPLTLPRSPQGRPVIVQAGASGTFQEVAARTAEVVFAVAPTLERAQDFRAQFRAAVSAAGRDPDSAKVLPGIVPIVADTDAEAQAVERELRSLVHPVAGLTFMSASMNYDLAEHPVDGPVPDVRSELRGSKGRFEYVIGHAIERGITLGELAVEYAASLSFPMLVGSATTVADEMERWYSAGGADGFVIMPAFAPGSVDDFTRLVVPELQARGLFRREYTGRTLRDHLGLVRPSVAKL
ncbi:LLM class flavin-dependent oxidoreductase [Pseudonocardia sp. NPDC049154]|uniref:LLM class flavin-dependent oxidoreductase n=1 Tax=Pseudonocardia sp. NPDC049154 TaxID=3155501 RepID=UPI0033E8BA2E